MEILDVILLIEVIISTVILSIIIPLFYIRKRSLTAPFILRRIRERRVLIRLFLYIILIALFFFLYTVIIEFLKVHFNFSSQNPLLITIKVGKIVTLSMNIIIQILCIYSAFWLLKSSIR